VRTKVDSESCSFSFNRKSNVRAKRGFLRTIVVGFTDNWSYKIILVPGPRTKLFDVRNLVLPYVKMQVLVEFFSCPTIYKIPETCPPSAFRCVVFSLIAVPNSEVATDTPSHVPPRNYRHFP